MGTRKLTNKDRRKWTKIPIFNDEYYVIVVFGPPKTIALCLEAWYYPKDLITKSAIADRIAGKLGVCFSSHRCHPVVAMPHRPKDSEDWGTLAHEAVQAIEHVLESIGETCKNEIMAHSVGAVVRLAGQWRPGKK
jgi:hypothetical protein